MAPNHDRNWVDPYTPDTEDPPTRRRSILWLARVALALIVALALPYSHMKWGASYPGDGQKAFGFVAMFTAICVTAASLYFALGSIIHLVLRRRQAHSRVFAELLLF